MTSIAFSPHFQDSHYDCTPKLSTTPVEDEHAFKLEGPILPRDSVSLSGERDYGCVEGWETRGWIKQHIGRVVSGKQGQEDAVDEVKRQRIWGRVDGSSPISSATLSSERRPLTQPLTTFRGNDWTESWPETICHRPASKARHMGVVEGIWEIWAFPIRRLPQASCRQGVALVEASESGRILARDAVSSSGEHEMWWMGAVDEDSRRISGQARETFFALRRRIIIRRARSGVGRYYE
ncbi:uncharacterized protein EV420DRAFT_1748100 [Desarmillaria tabescens]|uniref:Uncharacterized protein n=1 Tax=Armillaria tabescens TaxID=1929756 RepID=A0AA39N5X3_ARMTA|nr:uncharacterized protein EV420DRAFT_1748100 [Desarmillaria tabescens]KAK0458643.1 hypothetical protein EV420DRAFT_1748100 [Desarmillaria tabescens]